MLIAVGNSISQWASLLVGSLLSAMKAALCIPAFRRILYGRPLPITPAIGEKLLPRLLADDVHDEFTRVDHSPAAIGALFDIGRQRQRWKVCQELAEEMNGWTSLWGESTYRSADYPNHRFDCPAVLGSLFHLYTVCQSQNS